MAKTSGFTACLRCESTWPLASPPSLLPLPADLLATYTPNLTCNGSSKTPRRATDRQRGRGGGGGEGETESGKEARARAREGSKGLEWGQFVTRPPVEAAGSYFLFAVCAYLPTTYMYYYVLRRRTATRWPRSRLEPKLRCSRFSLFLFLLRICIYVYMCSSSKILRRDITFLREIAKDRCETRRLNLINLLLVSFWICSTSEKIRWRRFWLCNI